MENQEELVTIKTYYSDAEADFAKNILEMNGIKAMVAGRTSTWAGGGASFSPELKVWKKDAEKALKILEEAKQPVGGNESVPMIKRKEFLSSLRMVMIFAILFSLVMFFISWIINR